MFVKFCSLIMVIGALVAILLLPGCSTINNKQQICGDVEKGLNIAAIGIDVATSKEETAYYNKYLGAVEAIRDEICK